MQFSSAVVLSAVAGSALAAYSNSTVTDIQTTVVTITSCEENKCHETEVTTGVTTVTEVDTTTPPTAHCQPLKLQLHLLLLMFLPPLSPSPHVKKTNVTKPLSPPVSPLSLKVLPSTLPTAHCHLPKLQVQLHLLLKNLNQLNLPQFNHRC